MAGSQVVAVWYQHDGSNNRIYSNCSSDGGATWGSDQLIEGNVGFDGDEPQVAMAGSQVVAVWYQYDGSNNRIYSNCSSDGGATWGSDQLIEGNVGFTGYEPEVAMAGSQVVAVWYQYDGSNDRIYSNCGTLALPPPPAPQAVGGTVYPVNKVGILMPWVALAIAIMVGGIWLLRRRVHS